MRLLDTAVDNRMMPKAFVAPFLAGSAGRRPNSLPNWRRQNRDASWPTTKSSSKTLITSRLRSRQLLIHQRRKDDLAKLVQQDPPEQSVKNLSVLRRTGMNTPMVVSKEMQELVGQELMTRSQVITHLGKYIRKNGLRLEGNRRIFAVDQYLSKLLGVEGEHTILSLQRLVSPHLIHPKDFGPEYEERAKLLFDDYLKQKGAIDSRTVLRKKDPRGLNSLKRQKELLKEGKGMYANTEIDPCLRPLCGGRDRISRPQLLKAVWTYIKEKDLQDPTNRRKIIVDDGLRKALQITDADSIDCFHIGRYLWKLCKSPKAK